METVPVCRRGWFDKDPVFFGGSACTILHTAAEDICWLLDRGYDIRAAVTFAGNHYSLTERQRTALTRSLCSSAQLELRRRKELPDGRLPESVALDGFNTVITLETALSSSLLLLCRDNTVRDLAGLHGTYRIIDKTESAVALMLDALQSRGVISAQVYLDKQVSNSGRLKTLIGQTAEKKRLAVNINLLDDVDTQLVKEPCVITADSIVLDRCISWFNLNRYIIQSIPAAWLVSAV